MDEASVLEPAVGLDTNSNILFHLSLFPFLTEPSRNSAMALVYRDGISLNVQDILDKSDFWNKLDKLSAGEALAIHIECFLSPQVIFRSGFLIGILGQELTVKKPFGSNADQGLPCRSRFCVLPDPCASSL